MIDLLFAGVALVLLLAAGYWLRGRGGHRPTGTWAMAALLVSFACAFGSYVSVVENAVESVVPDGGRLLSNSFTLAAATSVLAFMLQLDLEPEEARRSIRRRVLFLGIFSMARGGEFNRRNSNKLMRWRIICQAVALAIFALLMLVIGKN